MEGKEIEFLREEIDGIDREILRLLNRRAEKALEIARWKGRKGLPVCDLSRERGILEALCSMHSGPFPASAVRQVFSEIISASRALQESIKVGYLGPEFTYSHLAAMDFFGTSCEFQPLASIVDVFQSVERDRVRFGVVPVENSTEGAVNLTLDLMIHSNLSIVGETSTRVAHSLLSREEDRDRIERVFSHPQAFGQCRLWLERNLPHRKLVETSSTAEAIRQAKEEKGSAAIGSERAALHYGLDVRAREIQDVYSNMTRFFVLGKGIPSPTGKDKTSILFTTAHRPGALHFALGSFADQEINLTRVESRPSKERPWDYIFFVDFEGHLFDEKTKGALEELEKRTLLLKVLGSYPAGRGF